MKSWKTTLFGILAASAGGVAVAYKGTAIGEIAGYLTPVFTGIGLYFSRDHSVTSEDAGLK